MLLKKILRRIYVPKRVSKLNLCCGRQVIPGYIGIDFTGDADIIRDLSKKGLPFQDNSVDAVICMSAINYFTRQRGQEIVREVYRILKPGGITRFGVQDMGSIAKRYVEADTKFFFQKLPDGKERFEGPTIGDKFAAWFYGYAIHGAPCKYFYDYESLEYLFKMANFTTVENKPYMVSRLDQIDLIDNRPDQMFFLEAVK
jgi:predicted SAM-dependent methyltransferase